MPNNTEEIKLLISYSHDDGAYFNVFKEGIEKVIKNTEHFKWSIWDDTKIHIGTFWDEEIQNNIQGCNVAMLLVSVGFMASRYIREKEYNEFIKRYENKGILIIPVMFAPCDYKRWEELPKLQFFKPNGAGYGKAEIEGFTYADLIKFRETDGTLIPNPNINRYHLDLVKKVESSYKEFLNRAEKKELIAEQNAFIIPTNKLKDYPRSKPYFTGRTEELDEFKKAIHEGLTFIAIDGGGGIGKTQFISRCIEKYISPEKVIYYDCTAASQLDTLISEAGYPDLLIGSSKSNREKFSAFKDKIQENEFFLFLDNFQETNSNHVFNEFLKFIQEYLKKGCVVVIDRDNIRDVTLTPKPIHIRGLKNDKSLEYARALIEHLYKNEVCIEDIELENLCAQLKGYPLAIDFAIYLLSEKVTPSDIITKIVQEGDVEKISERLLNAIFSRPDATQEERDFICKFSAFTGTVTEDAVSAVMPSCISATRQLQRKNLLSHSNGNYEIHPLVREFCYEKLPEKELTHRKIAEYYLTLRSAMLNPALEEQIFYHLSKGHQWEKIEREIDERGRDFIRQGQLALLKEQLDKLKKIKIEKPIFNIFYGDIAEIQGKWDEAKEYYNHALSQEVDKKVRSEGMIKYAEMLHRKGNVKEALPLYEEAYHFSNQNHCLKEEARALNDIGLVYKTFGQLSISLKKLAEALKIRELIDDKEEIATSFNNIGTVFHDKEDYDEALINYEKSLKISKEIGVKYLISVTLNNIGSVLGKKGKSDKALEKHDESLKLAIEIGDKHSIAASLNCIGIILKDKGKLEDAQIKNYESLAIKEEIGDMAGIATSTNNIGSLLKEKGKLEEALQKYFSSLKIVESIGDKHTISIVLGNIADIYADDKIKKYNEAVYYLIKSLGFKNQMGINISGHKNMLIDIRDNKIGLSKFKEFTKDAFTKLQTDLQSHIPLNELIKEPIRAEKKVNRNDPCPCGSGKKFKNCHSKNIYNIFYTNKPSNPSNRFQHAQKNPPPRLRGTG